MKTLLAMLAILITGTAAAANPCGLTGTLKERIVNCKTFVGTKKEFVLVTRTQAGSEIFQGLRTGVIWSADLKDPKNYLNDGVNNICSKQNEEFGGLNLKWILPPAERFIQALKYDIQSSLPGVASRDYWTSSSDSFYTNSRYIFEGDNRYIDNGDGMYTFRHLEIEDGLAYVKCIVETI